MKFFPAAVDRKPSIRDDLSQDAVRALGTRIYSGELTIRRFEENRMEFIYTTDIHSCVCLTAHDGKGSAAMAHFLNAEQAREGVEMLAKELGSKKYGYAFELHYCAEDASMETVLSARNALASHGLHEISFYRYAPEKGLHAALSLETGEVFEIMEAGLETKAFERLPLNPFFKMHLV